MTSPTTPDARRCPIATIADPEGARPAHRWPGGPTLALVALSYLACAAAATDPVIRTFATAMPGQLADPMEHLWILRWSKACLIEGRSPFFCPDLNYPTGVPLGSFPTMHLQTAAYLAMGLVTSNDVACFNALWFFGFVSTGVSTFLLAWWAVRSAWPAWLAGLGAMLSGPMMMHAHGHLETMQMGAVPLFLIAWLRFVDRPGAGRLASAAGLYLLVVASAPYFAVLAVFPAAWSVAWSTARSGDRRAWLAGRVGWLAGFAAIALPGLAVLFSGQIWAAAHGHPMARPRSQFNHYGAPPWSMFAPSPLHALGRSAAPGLFEATGYASRMSECSSYLGVVTLGLLGYAAARRVRFPRAGFWWSALALMVVLSWGAEVKVGPARVGLPAGWIYGIFPPFHLIRVPARFNLFAAVCAAVPASAALRDLLGRIPGRWARASALSGLGALMMVDLAMVPFETATIPPMPDAYRGATTPLVDAPMFGTGEGQVFSSLWGYWQSIHRAPSTAGYPGVPNVGFDAEVVRSSPFWSRRLVDPSYLADPARERFGPVVDADARDYAWLFLTAYRFDRVVFHHEPWFDAKYAAGGARVSALLPGAKAAEDADTTVFERARLRPPGRIAVLCAEGWRGVPGGSRSGVLRRARIVVHDPTPDRPMVLALEDASAFARPRVVRLSEGGRELARWTIEPGRSRAVETPPFRLGPGLHDLTLESDGDDRPTRHADRLDDARTPYSLTVGAVRLRGAD